MKQMSMELYPARLRRGRGVMGRGACGGGGSESEAVGEDKEMKVRMRKVGKSRMRTRRGTNKVEMVTGREVVEAAATI